MDNNPSKIRKKALAANEVLLVFPLVLALLCPISAILAFPVTLNLERVNRASNDEAHTRDTARYLSLMKEVATLEVGGSSVTRTYFVRLNLGTPPQQINLAFDTGSGLVWASCYNCNGCPIRREYVSYFDPRLSSTTSSISCPNSICQKCSKKSECLFSEKYVDGSKASGYYLSDVLYLDTVDSNNRTNYLNFPVSIKFGCSNYWSGFPNLENNEIDGILGFGRESSSFFSQLSSTGVIPNVFSHCLIGGDKGGGTLVLGEIVEPGMVYSPIVFSKPHYSLNMLSIAIGGEKVAFAPKVFKGGVNAILDTGTTYGFLPSKIYKPFVIALRAAIPSYLRPLSLGDSNCFIFNSSVRELFPLVSLQFEGDAFMTLKPENYLTDSKLFNDQWCIGFKKSPVQGSAILGEMVLKDMIISYDLTRGLIGMKDYDCSKPVNVSLIPLPYHEYPSAGISSRSLSYYQMLVIIVLFVNTMFVPLC